MLSMLKALRLVLSTIASVHMERKQRDIEEEKMKRQEKKRK